MGRTIDADVLKDAFEMDGYKSPYVARVIDSCPTVGEWISVKDRLPETYKDVLVSCISRWSGVREETPTIAWYTCFGWKCYDSEQDEVEQHGFTPTHWMPIPEPPKEE